MRLIKSASSFVSATFLLAFVGTAAASPLSPITGAPPPGPAPLAGGAGVPGAAIDFPAVSTNFTNGNWSLGWRFQTNAEPVLATHLGFYDSLRNGLTQSHLVGIFDDAGNLLATGTVVPGDPLTGFFRYTDIPDLLLAPNTFYVISAITGTEDYTWDPVGFMVDPRITYNADRFALPNNDNILHFPTFNVGVTGIFGPNFIVADVPEPATLLLCGLAGVGLAGYRLRRRILPMG